MKGSKRLRYNLLFILLFFLMSCSQSLEQDDYIAWVEGYENGLHVSRSLGDFIFDLQYKPAEYVRLQEKQWRGGHDPELSVEENMQYFTLSIGLKDKQLDFMEYNIETVEQRSQMLYYYSFRFQNAIYLEENGKKLPCVLYHFERSYDLKPTRTFVLGFEKPNKGDEFTKLVIDSPWLNTGPVKFHINKNNIPELKHPTNAS